MLHINYIVKISKRAAAKFLMYHIATERICKRPFLSKIWTIQYGFFRPLPLIFLNLLKLSQTPSHVWYEIQMF